MSQIDLQWFASPEADGRTEKPTETRLRKAREEGRVAKSNELNSVIVFFFTSLVLIFLAPWYEKKIKELFVYLLKNISTLNIKNAEIKLLEKDMAQSLKKLKKANESECAKYFDKKQT